MKSNFSEYNVFPICRDHFYQFGEIRNVKMVHKQHCAFVEYTTRQAAELAADQSFNKVFITVFDVNFSFSFPLFSKKNSLSAFQVSIHGFRLNVRWAKPQSKQTGVEIQQRLQPVPGLPGTLPLPEKMLGQTGEPSSQVQPGPAASSGQGIYYPSQDPSR